MRRRMLVTALAAGLLVVSATIALAAKPTAGQWKGSKSLTFSVNAAGTKITEFRPGGCAGGPLGWTMKVAGNGSFSLKKSVAYEGGRPIPLRISGKFTTPTSARGT